MFAKLLNIPLQGGNIRALYKDILPAGVSKALRFRHLQSQDISRVHCDLKIREQKIYRSEGKEKKRKKIFACQVGTYL